MSPSTSTPQEAFKIYGTWRCADCRARGKGGQREFYVHWLREHYVPPGSAAADSADGLRMPGDCSCTVAAAFLGQNISDGSQ